jgi:hypothetical protein
MRRDDISSVVESGVTNETELQTTLQVAKAEKSGAPEVVHKPPILWMLLPVLLIVVAVILAR